MTWTCDEAEQILREKWDDADQVGGFSNDWERVRTLQELKEQHGDAVDAYDLLGSTTFCDYEEGEQTTLWRNIEDNSLWLFRSGVSVYGAYGEDFANDIEPGSMEAWLSHVEANARWAENFQGC